MKALLAFFTIRPGISRVISILAIVILVFITNACLNDELNPANNNIELLPVLSDYGIFEGDPSDLVPAGEFKLYELSTELFTDYAEKQRLIRIPSGQTMSANGDGLPDFPDGTVFVKTFYYYHDKRDTSKGKKIIETRLQIKSGSKWNVGTYLWNDQQSEARLITTGLNKTINWIDENGNGNVISYHIPSSRECATCHSISNSVAPIGPKLRNLNREVIRDDITVNQLVYFHHSGILESVDPALTTVLPDWQNTSYSLSERARAYLDVNCAHCHNRHGYASDSRLYFNYEESYSDTRIGRHKDNIVRMMKTGKMPRLGTTMVHDEGLALIKSYIKSL